MQNPARFVLLALLAFIWGSSFILIKEGLKEFSPIQVGCLRLIISGLALAPFAIKFLKEVKTRDWLPLLIVAILGNGIPYFLFPLAQTHIGSGVAGMLNSLVPLFTLVISVVIFKNELKRIKLIGVLLGLVGAILLILSSGKDTGGNYLYGSFIILATICYAISVNTLKARLSRFNPLATAAIPLGMSMIPALIYLPIFEPIQIEQIDGQKLRSLIAVLLLALAGTGAAMIIFNRLIQLSSAVFASSVTYLIPLVAMFWGFTDGEKFGVLHFVGMTTVLIAVYLINKKERKLNI
ncbi:MAG: DMT family transporter [Bacteroidia bacterium]